MKRLFLLVIASFIMLISSAFAQQSGVAQAKSYYKTNKELSDYLDAQGFKVAISRAEATKLYNIDIRRQGYPMEYSSRVTNNSEYPIQEGFYAFKFSRNNVLSAIFKCIGIEKDIDNWRIQEAFRTKYKLQTMPANIIHHGRYIIVSLFSNPIGFNRPGKALILEIQDATEEFLEKEKEEQLENSSTERLKKKF